MTETRTITAAERILRERFITLGHESRWHLLMLLMAHGEQSVSSLVEASGLDQPKVSHHLAILRNNGLVSARNEHRMKLHSLSDAWEIDEEKGTIRLKSGGNKVRLEIEPGPWVETGE